MKPYETDIDQNELIGQLQQAIDYQDAFSIVVPITYQVSPVRLVKLFFDSIPLWTKALLSIRDWMARWIGLKTTQGLDLSAALARFKGMPGESIGFLQVLGRSEEELMAGESDRHLVFWLSFIGRPVADGFEVKLATAVVFNGWVGRCYFVPVKPLHRLIVPAVLRKMARNLMEHPQDYASQEDGDSL